MDSRASVKYTGHVRKMAKNVQMSGTVVYKNASVFFIAGYFYFFPLIPPGVIGLFSVIMFL